MAFQEVFNKQNRNAGTYTSPPQTITPTTTMAARMIMDATDIADPTIMLDIHAQYSTDAGATWRTYIRAAWAGGTDETGTAKTEPPEIRWMGNVQSVNRVRASVVTNKRFSWGVETEVI